MARSTIRIATIEDVVHVALNIRNADRNEIWASDKQTPLSCLISAYNRSDECRAFVVDGKVACIFGVVPISLLGGIGSPWMIGTDLIYSNKREFLRKSQNAVLDVCKSYATLINYVDKRNTLSIRWLKWGGVSLYEAHPCGPFGLPFHRFELRK